MMLQNLDKVSMRLNTEVKSLSASDGGGLDALMEQSKKCRKYNVIFEKNSSVMIFEDRVNVLADSENSMRNKIQTGRNS